MSHETRAALVALGAALPALAVALLLLWLTDWPLTLRVLLTATLVAAALTGAASVHRRVQAPLQTTASLLQGLREGNYSVRARPTSGGDALAEVWAEVNQLADVLQRRRLTEVETSALLASVMAELDVAVLAFDGSGRLRLVNPAAARLFGQHIDLLLGQSAAELHCDALLHAPAPRILSLEFPRASGRWELRRSTFRQEGLVHHLLVLSDVSIALREEERQAWRRLIRVISHELNNSLTPIKSIANSLAQLQARTGTVPPDDLARGLAVIEKRADGLNRFLRGYATLAKLPPPRFAPVDVPALVARVVQLDGHPRLSVASSSPCRVEGDVDQLEQLLINLVRNGTDAVQVTGGRVWVSWRDDPSTQTVHLHVDDEGEGIADGADVFVPFFTTKPGGTGIGLALCRQIADAHHGTVTLANRADGGCRATVRLPLRQG
jgi:two-component system, NtrC family, nitrogen regulation sensor histidine kinase NtrY